MCLQSPNNASKPVSVKKNKSSVGIQRKMSNYGDDSALVPATNITNQSSNHGADIKRLLSSSDLKWFILPGFQNCNFYIQLFMFDLKF